MIFTELLDLCPVCPSVGTVYAENAVRTSNMPANHYEIMCPVLPQISPSSRSNVLQLVTAEHLNDLMGPVRRCRSLVHTLAITENERFTVAIPSGQTKSCDKTGKASRRSDVIKACRSFVKEDCDRFSENTFHSQLHTVD